MLAYEDLYALDGEDCWTVARYHTMTMHVAEDGVTVVVPSGKERLIKREFIEEVMAYLNRHRSINGIAMLDEVGIRSANIRTKLFAVLARLPNVTVTLRPRTLHLVE